MLGWIRVTAADGASRDFYMRQLWDGKGSALIETMNPQAHDACTRSSAGDALAKAHARSGDAIAIASYLGAGDSFDRALASFAEAYADQNERDYDALQEAVIRPRGGRNRSSREGIRPEGSRMSDRPVFLYAAIYDEIADAEADYEAVFDLHAAGVIGTFDSAVIRKEDDGKVRVTKTEKPTQHGAWTGAGVGALVGILFPPALIGSAIVGAGAGGLIGHLSRGISRGDLKELGEELDAGHRRGDRARRVEDRGAAREGAGARQQGDREAGRRRRRRARARDRGGGARGQGSRHRDPASPCRPGTRAGRSPPSGATRRRRRCRSPRAPCCSRGRSSTGASRTGPSSRRSTSAS